MMQAAMRGVLPRVLLAVLLWTALPWAAADIAVPPLKTRVTDFTSTLSQDQRAALEQKLAALEARKGSQVAILLVPTTQPETVEQYAIRVYDQWKLGRKGVDDGVLLLVAKNDRKLRIEVGRGLEGAIPDAFAKRIIDEEMTPRFRQGDFYGGISAGVDRVARLVAGETMPPPARPAAQPDRQSSKSGWIGDALLYGFFAVLVVANLLQSLMGRLLGSTVAGSVAGIIAFVLAGLGAALVAGLVVFVISLFLGASRGSGWSTGGGNWSSGSGSWSSGSSGGFSGGGGSSGGGGASGSW